MIKKPYSIFFLTALLSWQAHGSANDNPFYLFAEIGGSFPHNTGIHVDTNVWDPVSTLDSSKKGGKPHGKKIATKAAPCAINSIDLVNFDPCGCCCPPTYGYDANFCSAPVFGIGFGYYFNDWISGFFSVNHRSRFKYRALQIPPIDETTPGFLGPKKRFFDFDNTSFMINVKGDYRGCIPITSCYELTIDPYGSFGVGMAKNTIYNFHSVTTHEETLEEGSFKALDVASLMSLNSVNRFAWQAAFGFEFSFSNQCFFGLNYRYFNGGTFVSNNYLLNTPDGFLDPIVVPPWCGKFATQELFVSFRIQF